LVIIHLNAVVVGSKPLKSILVQLVRIITIINNIIILDNLIKLSLRVTVPALMHLTVIPEIYRRVTSGDSHIPIAMTRITDHLDYFIFL
tara:strand:+ start:86 stop:352 length:267 start_codon:yes stop_codon:yes gene_type:complete